VTPVPVRAELLGARLPAPDPISTPVDDDTYPTEDFTQLVARMQRGDEAAFVAVYRAIQPPLLRYLTALVGAEAEDVASETWSQACRDLARFQGDGDGFRGWITTIGRHRALDYLRARGRRPIADVRLDALLNPPQTTDAESAALDSITTAEAIALIATLPRDQAEAVLLRSVMGLDAKSAGAVLGKRAGAVRTATYRGLRTLADQLEASPTSTVPPRSDDSGPGSAEGTS
jgi:RNA polymerase sigma-70 factor (ECF subfamily)